MNSAPSEGRWKLVILFQLSAQTGINRVINRWFVSLAFSATLVVGAATAQPAATPISLHQMQHTIVQPGGAPVGPILSLTQDADGFLWLATFKGQLLRVGGVAVNEPFAAQLKS